MLRPWRGIGAARAVGRPSYASNGRRKAVRGRVGVERAIGGRRDELYLARGGAWAERCWRRRVRVPDVRLLVLVRVHQGEADEEGGGEDGGHEDDRVEEAVVAQVHE